MNIKFDTKAPLSKGGKCPLCDINFSGGFKKDRISCPKCKRNISLENAIIYNLITSNKVIEIIKYLPIYGRTYHQVGDVKAYVGIKKKVILKKTFSNVKHISVGILHEPEDKSFKNISAVATNIRKQSFDLITSGLKKDNEREVNISYTVHYLDNRNGFPLWFEYLQIAGELIHEKDYKTCILMLTSMLDAFYDNLLKNKVNGYEIIVKKLNIPTKGNLAENTLNISLGGHKKEVNKLLNLRNKIAHGNRQKVKCTKEYAKNKLLLILKVMYICKMTNIGKHPLERIIKKQEI